jgi:hypothetical protein
MVNLPLTHEVDDIVIRDWRETIEVIVPSPKLMIKMIEGLQDKGWVGKVKNDVQRLLIGVEFDSSLRCLVAIKLNDLTTWTRRYTDGKTQTPVPRLTAAAEQIVNGTGPMLARLYAALAVEQQLYGVT